MAEYRIKSKRTRVAASNRISATLAAKNFGRLVDRVREEGATYVIERGGTPVAQIGPVERRTSTIADLIEFARTAPHVDEENLRDVEAAVKRHNKPRVPKDPWAR